MEEPRIAKEFKIGNTIVKIATNYCDNKSPEEINAILKNIAVMAQYSFNATAAKS